MKNSVGIIAAFLGGAIVGGALGLLFAPESGDETRKKIVEALEKKGIKLSKKDILRHKTCWRISFFFYPQGGVGYFFIPKASKSLAISRRLVHTNVGRP